MSTLTAHAPTAHAPIAPTPAAAARPLMADAERPLARVSLTRRGRLLISLLVLLALGALFVVSAGRSEAGDPASVGRTTQVVVQPGQTLWQVASAAMPGTDPREAVEHVRELNALTSSVVLPGQALVVPVPA